MIVQYLLNLKMISILPHIHTKLTAPRVYKLYKHITKNTATRGSKKNCGCFPKVSQSHKEIKVFKNNATPIMTRLVKKKRGGGEKGWCLLKHFLCHSYTTRSIQTFASVQDKVNSLVQQPDEEVAFLPFLCVQME